MIPDGRHSTDVVNPPFMLQKHDTHHPDRTSPEKMLKLPLIGNVSNKVRNHFIAMMCEFVGTFMFLFFAFAGTQVANAGAKKPAGGDSDSTVQAPDASIILFIALAFGFSLAVNVWIFFRVSGGQFNPAVSFALWLVGAITWVRASVNALGQILGGMAAAAAVSAILPGELTVSTKLGGGASVSQGLFLEMFLTAELVFTILMLAGEKHKATFLAPIGIGLSLFVAELTGVYFTGGSLNPARSFGPCVVLMTFPGYHWLYWLGPFMGATLAAGFFLLLKFLEYETANPGADFDERETERFVYNEDTATTNLVRPVVGTLNVEGQPLNAPKSALGVPMSSGSEATVAVSESEREFINALEAKDGKLGTQHLEIV